MTIDYRFNVFWIIFLIINAGCNNDDEFTYYDHQNTTGEIYPFQRGSVIAEDTAEFNFLEELYGYHTPTIIAEIEERNYGRVKINGFVTSESTISITFDWGIEVFRKDGSLKNTYIRILKEIIM